MIGHSLAMTQTKPPIPGLGRAQATALLVLADGTVLEGLGLGATGHAVGEVCFNTAMTGYQEILTDPSYAGPDRHLHLPAYRQCRHQRRGHRDRQHGGAPGARGVVLQADITDPSNYRAAAISTSG